MSAQEKNDNTVRAPAPIFYFNVIINKKTCESSQVKSIHYGR